MTLSEFAGIVSGKMKCKIKIAAYSVGFESIRSAVHTGRLGSADKVDPGKRSRG
jgi:hypothetical protein